MVWERSGVAQGSEQTEVVVRCGLVGGAGAATGRGRTALPVRFDLAALHGGIVEMAEPGRACAVGARLAGARGRLAPPSCCSGITGIRSGGAAARAAVRRVVGVGTGGPVAGRACRRPVAAS